VVVTIHRRENWRIMPELARALRSVAEAHEDHTFVFPVHLNPVIRESVYPLLSSVANVRLIEPLGYFSMAALIRRSRLIVTDSGGLQEDGVTLGIPVVVLRDKTERPEGLDGQRLVLAGVDPSTIGSIVSGMLARPSLSASTAPAQNPYGDGYAAQRVVKALLWQLGLGRRPDDWRPAVSQ
jgi:UDP-N-acetylglucosamine 2-epimerase (non-hydrolysing)